MCVTRALVIVSSEKVNTRLLFSNAANEAVSVSLRANVTTPAGPGINVTPAVNIGWTAQGCTGVRQYAYRSEPVYTPLFCLRSIRKPLLRRDDSGLGVEA